MSLSVDTLVDYLADHPHMAHLIQRAVTDDSGSLQSIAARLMTPLYDHGRQALAAVEGVWTADQLPPGHRPLPPHLRLLRRRPLFNAVGIGDALAPETVERQRRFLKAAIIRLFGLD